MDNRKRIQKSLDYIEDHLQTQITAAELADMTGFSLYHYYRLFQKATGLPVMQYILRRRLLHGIYAIKLGSLRTEAALRYGFDTYAGFYKAFCREFGSTPSAFLQSCRARRPYRIDITKEDHMTIPHKKITQILKNWNLDQEPLSDVYDEGTGNRKENTIYIGSSYVLKYTTDLEKLQKQLELSRTLAGSGLLSSTPLPASDGSSYIQEGDCCFYVTRRLPGKQMLSATITPSEGRFTGEILGQLHLALQTVEEPVAEADLLSTLRDWALPRAGTAMGLSDAFCREYMAAFTELYPQLPRQIIHRDPHPGNIICADDSWGFLDFELAERNVRIYDPCYAATAVLSETFGQNNDLWIAIYRNIILGYDSVAHLSDAERKAIPYVLLANQFVCIAWFAEQEKYAELFSVNKEMTAWLIEKFEELKDC